ncbi:MAG: hypothetical protein U5L45_00370 [Saprospiraceae bacterium]|nr:hypothetical protein [Saprospiraceae bacterium]
MKNLFIALFALLYASVLLGQGVTSKCCPVTTHKIAYNGNVDASNEYPETEITNRLIVTSDGTRFVKFRNFGYVINYPDRTVQLYWLAGASPKRLDFAITKPSLNPTKYPNVWAEEFEIKDVGLCRIFFNLTAHAVVGAYLEHWGFPDVRGQRTTFEAAGGLLLNE